MTTVEQIARFAIHTTDADFSEQSWQLLKRNILDTIGCAIGALNAGPTEAVRRVVEEFGGNELCTLIGGGRTTPDRAAFYNGALVRYLDFMDNFNAKKEACHPCDNFAGILAVAEYAYGGRSGQDFLTALAVAYQVQCRLLETLPTMSAGLNHTTLLAFSIAAGSSRLLGLSEEQAANAIALSGSNGISLAVQQAEPVSQWKGLSSADAAMRAVNNTFLARGGVTGPPGAFEGPLGYFELIKEKTAIDWSKESLDVLPRTSIKKFNGELHSQSAIEATVELQNEHNLSGDDIEEIVVDVFKEAYEVIGGGEYGQKTECHTKEQADHNLKYMVAVALLDRNVLPPQYQHERINSPDVQALLVKVTVKPKVMYTWRYPKEMPVSVKASDAPV